MHGTLKLGHRILTHPHTTSLHAHISGVWKVHVAHAGVLHVGRVHHAVLHVHHVIRHHADVAGHIHLAHSLLSLCGDIPHFGVHLFEVLFFVCRLLNYSSLPSLGDLDAFENVAVDLAQLCDAKQRASVGEQRELEQTKQEC